MCSLENIRMGTGLDSETPEKREGGDKELEIKGTRPVEISEVFHFNVGLWLEWG
jgi:hypothetical protein